MRLIDDLKAQGRRVALWGASHQGFTIIACAGIGEKIEYIIDSAEFKQGKYSPATHIEIISPAKPCPAANACRRRTGLHKKNTSA